MSFKLYLTEKPKTARQLCDVLGPARHVKSSDTTKFGGHKQGDGWAVTWLSGHFFRLFEPHEFNPQFKAWNLRSLPIIYDQVAWKPLDASETISVDDITEQIRHIQSLYPNVSELILATDGDQEGQLLGQVFIEQTGWTGPVKRLWTDLWEPSGLQKSLQNLRDNSEFLGTYQAGVARVLLDQIVGINLTRLFTLKAQQSGYNMVANTGRVRSAALSVVVDHEAVVNMHTAREYHSLRGTFEVDGQTFNGKLIIPDHLLEDKKHCFDKAAIESIQQSLIGEQTAEVISVTQTENSQKPPKPFSQNTLAQFCNLHNSMMPDEVLATCQSLYEAGYLSYPRVEVEVFETDVLAQAPAILGMLSDLHEQFHAAIRSANLGAPQPVFLDSEVDGHSAIFVSSLKPDLSTFKPNELFVYRAVAMRLIAQFMPDIVTAQSSIALRIKSSTFLAESQALVAPGWSVVEPREANDKPPLPPITKESKVGVSEITLQSRNTKAPPRLTVDAFLSILKDCTHLLTPKVAARVGKGQLGTGATQPAVIKTLVAQGVIQIVDKKYVVPTKRGRDLRALLPDLIASVDLTSIWEFNFRLIRSKQISHQEFIEKTLAWLAKVVEAGKAAQFPKSPTLTPCERCGSAMLRKSAVREEQGAYWFCSNEDCRTSVPDIAGLPMKLLPDHGKPCEKCGEPLVTKLRKKDKQPFLSCSSVHCKKTKVETK